MQKHDDILLLKLVQSGDEIAFKYIFDTYFVSLCRFSRLYIDNVQDAEELVLDLFTYLWENKEHININLSLKAYLFQSVKNRCLNYKRSRKSMLHIDEVSSLLKEEESYAIEVKELEKLIVEAICSLPEKCQEIFNMSRRDKLTNKEIASTLNISIKTVEAHITKALKLIKSYLDDKYYYLF